VGGERGLHSELESTLAAFLGYEAALVLISGYLTNVTVLGHVVGGRDLILYDELCHNSIIAGIASSKAEAVQFPHNDLDTLDLLLTRIRGGFKRALIVAESLYSMDGDVVDLPRLIEIKRHHDCWLMVDEAHSLGVLGATGRGLCEHFGTDPAEIDLLIGTMSKTFVSSGGFIAGAAEVIRWLKYTLPGFVYSVGISPASAAAAREAVAVVASEPERVARLQMLSRLFLSEARRRGLNTGNATGCGVVPILFANDVEAIRVSVTLANAGIYVPPIVRIGVPKDKPRLRFFISAAHTPDDIVRTLDLVAAASTVQDLRSSAPPGAEGH
jgi:7-keto-8-aminopelargonate synthetase-like enzyme